ncbi:MAG: hypothetical protein G8345_14565 [Magnetococcales bacterium]|nr:hypothetical protein [Magnetococcales bacterium]
MSRRAESTPMERLIRRCVKNGIKTISGQDNRLNPVGGGQPRLITYQGDRATFLALLQYDAAHLDSSFDQGARAIEFAQLVERIASELNPT